MTQSSPWWTPDRHMDRRAFLLTRNRIKDAIRAWFRAQGFVEVDPGCLQVSPGNEAHLHAFQTRLIEPDRREKPLYLHTSPEFACKKLIAAGEQKLFTFAPVFRNCERGPLHSPEFTMLEWYRAGDDTNEQYSTIQNDCSELIRIAMEISGIDHCSWRGRKGLVDGEMVHLDVPEAIEELTGIKLLETIGSEGEPRLDALCAAYHEAGHRAAPDESWGDLFSKLMVEVEARYGELKGVRTGDGIERALLLDGYPAAMSPLARPQNQDTPLAMRFEIFMCGIELANGFGESSDAEAVRAALRAEMAEKQKTYGEEYPIDDDFIDALSIMPSKTAGCAMGFDRLVILATGATHIEQVLWTPVPR